MEPRRNLRATGKHEAPERLEPVVDGVTGPLEPRDLVVRHPEALARIVERYREIGTEIEELVLDALEPGDHRCGRGCRQYESDGGVQLVDRPVRLETRVGLLDSAPVAEARLARVAAPGVDPCQPDGLVAS